MAIISTLQYKTAVDLAGLRSGVGSMIDTASFASNRIQAMLGDIRPAADRLSLGFDTIAKSALAIGSAAAVAAAAFKGFDFLKGGIAAASDLNETVNKLDSILGDSSAAVKVFSDDLAHRFGLIKSETLEAAAGIGGLAKSLGGLKGESLSGFAKQFTMMASELTSINNMDMKSATDSIRIGLSGEQSDALKQLGIVTTETAVKQYALASGIAKVGKELDEQQKFMSRAGLIAKGLAFANGDLAKTINDPANAYRKLTGTITNLSASIGSDLMPAVKTAAGLLNSGVGQIGEFFSHNKPAVEAFASTLTEGFKRAGSAVAYLAPSFLRIGETARGALADLVGAVGSIMPSFGSVAGGLQAGLDTINAGLQGVIGWIKAIPTAIDDAFGAGSVTSIVSFVAQFGGIAAVAAGVGSALALAGTALGAVVAVFGSVPVLVGLAGAAVVSLAGNFIDWNEVIGTVGFGVRNLGDLWGIAQLKIGSSIAYVIDTLALIPTNLGLIANYIGSNWLDLVTAPFKAMGALIAELGKTIANFMRNPTGGVSFDIDAVLKPYKDLQAKLPELVKATPLDVDPAIQDYIDHIAKKETAYKKALGKPFEMPPPALAETPTAAKQVESMKVAEIPTASKVEPTKLTGALELGSKEAYSVVAHARAGGSSQTQNLERINQQQLGATNKGNEILDNIAKKLGNKPRPLVI